ncbi:MAG: hypothetical protein MRJ93_08870 [Nitrososphaeraceae archaeon]|nr:hypothetical protein [Nitrososphaeraceae archaeon]
MKTEFFAITPVVNRKNKVEFMAVNTNNENREQVGIDVHKSFFSCK